MMSDPTRNCPSLNEVVPLRPDVHEVSDEAELALALHLAEHRVEHDVDAGAADARAAMDDDRPVRVLVHRRRFSEGRIRTW